MRPPLLCRRRILRHLYSGQLRRTYLLQGCKQKFVDALLAVSRIDCYMPNEDILLEGDYVNELFMVVRIGRRHQLNTQMCLGMRTHAWADPTWLAVLPQQSHFYDQATRCKAVFSVT